MSGGLPPEVRSLGRYADLPGRFRVTTLDGAVGPVGRLAASPPSGVSTRPHRLNAASYTGGPAEITGWHAAWLQRFQDRAPELVP